MDPATCMTLRVLHNRDKIEPVSLSCVLLCPQIASIFVVCHQAAAFLICHANSSLEMENVYYLFKKRMVYPEKLNLDQVADKFTRRSLSWCNEPLERISNNIIFLNVNQPKSEEKLAEVTACEIKRVDSGTSECADSQQFIQDRIRHLVDAFSTRAHQVRRRLENIGTSSSLSSSDTEPTESSISTKPRLSVSLSDKYVEEKDGDIRIESPRWCGRFFENMKIVDPNGKSYIVWMSVVTMAVLYNIWVIPLRSTFPYQTPKNRAYWMIFDYFSDLVYIMDMLIVQPRIKYLNEGFWVTDIKLLRQNYVKNKHFKLDLASLLPLDLFYLLTGPDFVILRLPRFLKLHSFWELFGLIDRQLSNPYVIRITKTLMYMMYLIHLNACAYYAFSNYEGIGSNSFVFNGQGNAYIKCFYFATKTATSIGKNPKPSQDLEYIFMTFSWLMGVFVFALLIGQIRDIISTATRLKTEYRKLVDETLEYMRNLNLPQEMQRRVQLWFNYTWETQHTLDENRIMEWLPHKMKTDIAINVHMNTLNKVKLFADCDEALRRELVLQLKSAIYLPGDMICRKGDIGTEMYIIQTGQVEVIGRSPSEVLATLSEGSVFGEISLLGIPGMNRRTADVRSKGYSNLFVLDKASLNQALFHYPEAQKLLNKKAKQLMKQNAALEKKHNTMIVISNPVPSEKNSKLLQTILKVLPEDSKSNKLLRYGSRQMARKPEESKFRYRNSLPVMRNTETLYKLRQRSNTKDDCAYRNLKENEESSDSEGAKVTVHRTMS